MRHHRVSHTRFTAQTVEEGLKIARSLKPTLSSPFTCRTGFRRFEVCATTPNLAHSVVALTADAMPFQHAQHGAGRLPPYLDQAAQNTGPVNSARNAQGGLRPTDRWLTRAASCCRPRPDSLVWSTKQPRPRWPRASHVPPRPAQASGDDAPWSSRFRRRCSGTP
jgi:hypothetical protein